MDLSVIIVSYRVKYFLEHCLLSVLKARMGMETEIFVVDNNSADGSREYLEPKFPSVNFIWRAENSGFAKANNSVLEQTTGDYILFLNPDTILPEDCFQKCISFFKANKNCGAAGVRMIDGSGRFLPESKRALPTALSGFFKLTGLAKTFPRAKLFTGYYAENIAEQQNGKVDILAGAFMMLSREAIEKTKGFDDDFFMYGEDMDLSYRVLKTGLQNYYLGEITILHFKGESTGKGTAEHVNHFYGAMKRFANKHYGKNILRDTVIGIGKKRALSRIGIVNKVKAGIENNAAVIIGAETVVAQKISMALSQNKYQPVIIDPDEINDAAFRTQVSDKKIGNIIYCEGELTNKRIIDHLQTIPENLRALFYENGATSLVGSPDKNSKGIFITMN